MPLFNEVSKVVEENTDFSIVSDTDEALVLSKSIANGGEMTVEINPQLYSISFDDDDDDEAEFDIEDFDSDDEDSDDEDSEELESPFVQEEVPFSVVLANASGKEIHLDCTAHRSEGDHSLTVNALYVGQGFGYAPDIPNLDEDLTASMSDFLNELGVTDHLGLTVVTLAQMKEHALYTRWLEGFDAFLENSD